MPYISNKLKKILELDVHFLEVPRANCGDLMGNGTKITLSKPSYFFRSVATCKRWRHTSAHHHFRKYFLTTELKIEINSIHYDTLSLILTFFSYFPPSITSPPPLTLHYPFYYTQVILMTICSASLSLTWLLDRLTSILKPFKANVVIIEEPVKQFAL